MRAFAVAFAGGVVLVLLLAAEKGALPALALSQYQTLIPNGAAVTVNGAAWPGVGHVSPAGGTARNPFGLAFAAANHQWTAALCRADSDGDGASNGMELGDPDCVWTPGATPARTTGITHPGFPDGVQTLGAAAIDTCRGAELTGNHVNTSFCSS